MKEISIPEAIKRMVDGEECIAVGRITCERYNVKFIEESFVKEGGQTMTMFGNYLWFTKPQKKTVPMTEQEILAWQCNRSLSDGWCLVGKNGAMHDIYRFTAAYITASTLKRALISEDGTIGEPEDFVKEVEE